MDQEFEIKHIKGIIRRRKPVFILIFFVVLILSVAVAMILPPIYRSQATILIENQQIPTEYVRSSLTGYVEERLEMITRQVMSRSQLEGIIDKFDLYPEMRRQEPVGSIIELLSDNIELETIHSDVIKKSSRKNTGNMAATAFTLSYQGKNPETVQGVAQELAALYLKEDLTNRKKRVSATTSFLEQEAQNLKQQIHDYEQKISVFKARHIGELPEDNPLIIQSVSRYENELDRVMGELRSLQENKIYMEGELENIEPLTPILTEHGKVVMNPNERLKALRLEYLSLSSTLSSKHPDVRRLKREITELEKQVGQTDDLIGKARKLNDLKGQLAQMKGKLSSKHPDVILIKKQIDSLSEEVNESASENARKLTEEKPDNPAYIRLKTQIASTEVSIKTLLNRKDEIEKTLAQDRAKMENVPVVERQYKELTRDYNSATRKYQEIMNKLLEAKVAEGMASSDHGEKFTIIEAPRVPEEPYKPNRLAIILMGVMVALGAGVGGAVFQESMDDSIKRADDLSTITEIPLFTVVSMVETEFDRRARRIRHLVNAVSVTALIIAGLFLVDYYVMPVENLWELFVERLKS